MRRRLTVSPVPVMWRPNTSEWALRGRLGAVAERGLRQEPGARSFSGDGRHQRSRGSRAMIREAFLPKKSHPATLAVVEHANGIMHWLGCAMHDPLAQPPAFSHLLHNQPPERQKQVAGSRSRGAYLGEVRWFVLVLGPFLARGASASVTVGTSRCLSATGNLCTPHMGSPCFRSSSALTARSH
jgi:hypothetical protein